MDWDGRYLQSKSVKSVAILYDSDVPTDADQATKEMPALAKQYGFSIVGTQAVSSTTTDLSSSVSKLVDKKPEAIGLFLSSLQNKVGVSAVHNSGFSGVVFGGQGLGGNVLKGQGPAAEGVVWATDFSPRVSTPEVQKLIASYKTVSGTSELPTNYTAEGYDAAWFLARAVKASSDASRSGILKGLNTVATQGFTGALGNVRFAGHAELSPGVLVGWVNNAEVPVKGFGN
jgi:branched-chain amino acid transport system substrate-binding protein